MSKIKDYVCRVMDSKGLVNTLFGAILVIPVLGVVGAGLEIYSTIKASNPNPPIYRDVNGDRVDDKIIQKKVEKEGILWTRYYTLEDEVLFGVEVNGKKLYLPKDQFE